MFLPELIQPQLPPELAGQPTVAEHTWVPQLQLTEPNLNPVGHVAGNDAIVRKQTHRRVLLSVLIEYRQALSPRRFLLVVNLPQIQHPSLCCLTRREPTVFHDAEVSMLLAVFLA